MLCSMSRAEQGEAQVQESGTEAMGSGVKTEDALGENLDVRFLQQLRDSVLLWQVVGVDAFAHAQ